MRGDEEEGNAKKEEEQEQGGIQEGGSCNLFMW
jgi:hypothetical protein